MKEQQAQQLTIYIVSDSIGETAQRMIHATLTQFPDLTQIEIKKFPYIKDENEFLNVLELAHEKNAIVVTTLVSESFNALGHQYAQEHQISYIDYMSELITMIEQHTQSTPLMESGALRKMNTEYFKRIEAIEYSVKYDDGKHFTDIGEADALIVGVSRTSKTPLSMYLANKGYKIANIPLVPEVTIPESVFQHKGLKVFGLTASPNYIANIRKNRAEALGISKTSTYNSLDRIKKELSYAEEIFNKLNATVINTEYKSIEESAFYIEKFLQQND
ncbi:MULTISPECIES: pyruvate, water dikinase regulatory protein [Staphylococcus]|uniref:Putative pyruvate, phosphate dikinase regulatory protein n=4 Tax=Bacteria TaxID=2 RepID=A0A364UPC3_STAWA|nr:MULTISPECIES: pyruvate, water dikinase regulatory protein [Staphylococcus]PAK72649.1 phosphoenolpyruvate synthase regulatory protein [Staphylococcus pasteuri]COP89559.1 phosphotransferase CD2411 [Streptococcus pneumoniae]SKR78285.1 Putative phosphotransferase yqfL [Mycobacteroides abscessus subsp. abscessus]AGC89612.1 PEP synthetase regulatory protein [Staphylococcus warneri SG1]AXZ22449.1 kinase/pyrophosphorylase [Staphylococcus warneri]